MLYLFEDFKTNAICIFISLILTGGIISFFLLTEEETIKQRVEISLRTNSGNWIKPFFVILDKDNKLNIKCLGYNCARTGLIGFVNNNPILIPSDEFYKDRINAVDFKILNVSEIK